MEGACGDRVVFRSNKVYDKFLSSLPREDNDSPARASTGCQQLLLEADQLISELEAFFRLLSLGGSKK